MLFFQTRRHLNPRAAFALCSSYVTIECATLKLSVWGSKCGPCLESNVFTERTGAKRQMTGRTTLRVIRSVPSGSDGVFTAHEATTSLAVLSAHTFTTLPQQGSNPVSSSSLSGSFATKQRIHSSYLPQPSLPYHAHVVPILQSTGFGKPKLCVHLSAQQAGLLACVHQHRPFQPQPFPSQDRLCVQLLSHLPRHL